MFAFVLRIDKDRVLKEEKNIININLNFIFSLSRIILILLIILIKKNLRLEMT
jgi:hypothetical protein